jgi:hypothetical protein
MISNIGQWVYSLKKKFISENDLLYVNFEDVQNVIRNRCSAAGLEVRPETPIEEDCFFDSDKLEPLLITTIPITFMNSHGKRGEIPLIDGTLPPEKEEAYINELLETLDMGAIGQLLIVVYGQNATDKTVNEKAIQLISLGFSSVCIYSGGMFEWSLLQDVYGQKEFPITPGGSFLEPLLFKGKRVLMDG